MYISFIITARNDGYGRNFTERLRVSTTVLSALIEKYKLDAEIVVVDYNPLPGADPICRFIHSSVRTLTVTPDMHRMLDNPQNIPVYEFIGKNAAIRRIDSEFICATNADIIFTDLMMEYFVLHKLEYGKFYRCNRRDLEEGFIATPESTYIELIGKTAVIHEQEEQWPLHYNACGDFTLMSRGDWHRLKGYPELPYNAGIDSALLYLAHAKGMEQVVLPFQIFHQWHQVSKNGHAQLEWWNQENFSYENDDRWGLAWATL